MKDALALALVHFLWQGALLAIAGALLMRAINVPAIRYAIGVGTMVAMLLAPAATFVAIQTAADPGPRSAPAANPGTGPRAEDAVDRHASTGFVATRGSQPASIPTNWVLGIWAIGVLVLSLRFLGGLALARRLATHTVTPVSDELEAVAARLAERLRVRAAVRVCQSATVAVPVMIGWLRPVIILPAAVQAALPLSQLEALLAHEFAHIRRHDYLVNLLQICVETVCFYHPGVWWISREVRRQREQCCDDVAVAVCDRLTYVTALSSVASVVSLATPQLALSATGRSLRDRIYRLIEPSTVPPSRKGAWIAMLPILLVAALVAPQAWGTQVTSAAAASAASAEAAAAPVAAEAQSEEQTRPATTAESINAQYQARLREATRAQAARDVESRREERSKATERARLAELRNAAEAVMQTAERRRGEMRELAQRQLSRNEQTLAEIEVRQQERTLARQRELFEKGLATRSAVAESEDRLQRARAQLERAELMNRLGQQREEAQAARPLDRRLLRRGTAIDSNAALQVRDRLTINIEGEPDLPTAFTVREDGSIRFPFLGSIRVQGSTTAQVQSVIQKLISDKGLGRNPVVKVSAQRFE